MKKFVSVCCAVLLGAVMWLAACGKPEPEHEHSWSDWTAGATAHTRVCGCGETESADHTFDGGVVTRVPNCTVAGEKTYTCTVCGGTKKEPVPANGHSTTGVTPTWMWTGYTSATATFECNDCEGAETVTATGTAITSAVTTAAGCETKGERTYTATVTLGGKTYTDTATEEIPAAGHSYASVTPDWSWTGYTSATAAFKCDNCEHTETVTATGADIADKLTKAPTADESGTRTYTATVSFDGNTYTDDRIEILPATGHSYAGSVPTWSWTGYTSATATFKCDDCAHTESVSTQSGDITSAVTTAADCEANGERTYTATVTFDGREFSGTTTEEIPATGAHTYSDAWTYGADTHWHASTCLVHHADSALDKSDEADHDFYYDITAEPTFTQKGSATKKCDCGYSEEPIELETLTAGSYGYSESGGKGTYSCELGGVTYSFAPITIAHTMTVAGNAYSDVRLLGGAFDGGTYTLSYTAASGFAMTIGADTVIGGNIAADAAVTISRAGASGTPTLTLNGDGNADCISLEGNALTVDHIDLVIATEAGENDKSGINSGASLINGGSLTVSNYMYGLYLNGNIEFRDCGVSFDIVTSGLYTYGDYTATFDGATVTGTGMIARRCSVTVLGTTRVTTTGATDAFDVARFEVGAAANLTLTNAYTGTTKLTGIKLRDSGAVVINGTATIVKYEHAIGHWNNNDASVDVSKGILIAQCCGDAFMLNGTVQLADKVRHNTVDDAAVAETCTTDGLTAGSHCADCGRVLVAQQVIDATGHSYSAGSVTDPTFTTAGSIDSECSVCHHVVNVTLPVIAEPDYTYSEVTDGGKTYAVFTYYDDGEPVYTSARFEITRKLNVGNVSFNNVNENYGYGTFAIEDLTVSYESGTYTLSVADGKTVAVGKIKSSSSEGIVLAGTGTLNVRVSTGDSIDVGKIKITSGTVSVTHLAISEAGYASGTTGIAVRSSSSKAFEITGGSLTVTGFENAIGTWSSGKLYASGGTLTIQNCYRGIYMPYFDYANDARIDLRTGSTVNISTYENGIYAKKLYVSGGTTTLTHLGDGAATGICITNGADSNRCLEVVGGTINISGYDRGITSFDDGNGNWSKSNIWHQSGTINITNCKAGILLPSSRMDIGREVGEASKPVLNITSVGGGHGIEIEFLDIVYCDVTIAVNGQYDGLHVNNWFTLNNSGGTLDITNNSETQKASAMYIGTGGNICTGFYAHVRGFKYGVYAPIYDNNASKVLMSYTGISWDHKGATYEDNRPTPNDAPNIRWAEYVSEGSAHNW